MLMPKGAISEIVADVTKEPRSERSHEEDDDAEEDDGELEAFADDLVSAIKGGDAKKVASAFKAMFIACDMGPHDEGMDD